MKRFLSIHANCTFVLPLPQIQIWIFFLQCLRDLSVKAFMVMSFCCVLILGSKDWVCILETFNWCVCMLSSSGHKFLQSFHFHCIFCKMFTSTDKGGKKGPGSVALRKWNRSMWQGDGWQLEEWFCALLKISNIPPRDFNYWRLELFLLVGKHFVNGWEVTTRQRSGAALC